MELSPKQQIVELVNKSKNILLITHVNPDGDALGSILALHEVLRVLGKNPTAVCSDTHPKVLNFLPNIEKIKNDADVSKDFIISVNTLKGKISKLGYKNYPNENKLNIIITPDTGVNLTKDDISFNYSQLKFDLVFVLDAPSEERLGSFYINNPDLFYETPIINIDHHPTNSYFGKVNWVDLTATSTSEILVSLIESLGRGKNIFSPEVATALLTGIITDTGSFQHPNTTPKSFTVAAQLVAAGGNQQQIIKHVFKTKTLSTLKIWGKVLSNIKEEKEYRFIYSSVSATDYKLFNADPSETAGVVDELLKTAPSIDFALLLTERSGNLHGSLRSASENIDVAEIAKMFGGGGHKMAAAFQVNNRSLAESEDQVIDTIKKFQLQKNPNLNNSINTTNIINEEELSNIA